MASFIIKTRSLSNIFKRSCSLNTDLFSSRYAHNGKVRIGCASGFWGDTMVAAPQLVHHGNIDYLVFDYLSEITMSLLAKAKQKNPEFGYAPDFVHYSVGPLLKTIKDKGIKVISNAGGINPIACAAALRNACEKANVDMNIAVVTGDDLMPILGSGQLQDFNLPKNLVSMNAYLGAGPIAQALNLGADVVITGRCVDSAVTLAPLLHSFNWDPSDYDLMASGSLAGHLIECGAQVTGGIFTDWEIVPDWDNIGFPIIECYENGDFIVTKPPGTGGLISTGTVSEQIVYEIADPANYYLPDVVCKFSDVSLASVTGKSDTIAVTGATGKKPTDFYKVSATYMDAYRATAVTPIVGPNSVSKGERVADAIIERCQGIFRSVGLKDFKRINVEMLGSEGNYGTYRRNSYTRECVSWIAVEHEQKKALEIFVKELAPAGTGMAPGLTTIVGGRPKVTPVLKLHSFMFPKSKVDIDIHMNGEIIQRYEEPTLHEHHERDEIDAKEARHTELKPIKVQGPTQGSFNYTLGELAYTRSGDKGNDANIGVVCRNPEHYGLLGEVLTAEAVEKYFIHFFDGAVAEGECRVSRFELPGIHAYNFVLKDVLGGGGVASLRSDPQGKSLGQMFLDFRIRDVPELSI